MRSGLPEPRITCPNAQEGTCKTCEAKVGNGRAKICVTQMPNKDVTIKYNVR